MRSRNLIEDKEYIEEKRRYLMRKKARLIKMQSPAGLKADVSFDYMRTPHQQEEAFNVMVELANVQYDLEQLAEQEAETNKMLTVIETVRDSNRTAAEKVRILREDAGMKLADIAEELDLSLSYVCHLSADLKKHKR